MAKIISLFNHKGGVSKTTTAFNLGWMLATKNKRVLLVDCDPQCNLTGMVLGYRDIEEANGIINKDKAFNIRDGLSAAFESKAKLIEPVECSLVPGNQNLFLLPGHIGLAEYEVTLGIAQELSGSLPTLQNLPGAIKYLIDVTANKYNIDIVIVDMSPSLGAINQNLLMVSDFFIVPMNPDYFSTLAIESLSKILPKWKAWANKAKETEILRNAVYPFPNSNPKYLGSIIQKYRPKNGMGPSRAFQKWVDDLNASVENTLIPKLEASGMLLDKNIYKKYGFDTNIPLLQMSDFNSLIAVSQDKHKPIFDISDEDFGTTGVVLEGSKTSMQHFKTLFSDGADKVIGVINEVSP